MTTPIMAQDIRTPFAEVDTGNDWMDLGFVIVLIFVVAGALIAVRRFGK